MEQKSECREPGDGLKIPVVARRFLASATPLFSTFIEFLKSWYRVGILSFAAVQIQRVVVDVDVENFLNGFFDRLDARVAKLNHLARIGHDDVVVVFVKIRFLVMRLVLTKLVLADKRAIEQQFNGVVQCGAAHAIVFVFHFEIQMLNVKMFLAIVNFLKYGVAFGCFSVAFGFKIHRKNVLYDLLIFAVIGGNECHAAKVGNKLQSFKGRIWETLKVLKK
jgi:hypothetical protein